MSAGPLLLVLLELKELPVAIVLASSAEDEARLRAWLTSASARAHVLQAVEDALLELAGRQAA